MKFLGERTGAEEKKSAPLLRFYGLSGIQKQLYPCSRWSEHRLVTVHRPPRPMLSVPPEKKTLESPASPGETLANRSLKASLVQREVARDSVTEGL